MICTFVSHCILMIKISQFLLLNWCRGCSRLHSNQELVSLFFSVAEKTFFPLLFWDFLLLISLFLFLNDMQSRSSVYDEKFSEAKRQKNRIFVLAENSLSDADCMCMFHYNGKLVWVIYGDVTKSLGPIRISFPRWV